MEVTQSVQPWMKPQEKRKRGYKNDCFNSYHGEMFDLCNSRSMHEMCMYECDIFISRKC